MKHVSISNQRGIIEWLKRFYWIMDLDSNVSVLPGSMVYYQVEKSQIKEKNLAKW